MTKDFFIRLEEYYSNVGKVLKGEADSASIFPNTTDIGMSRERIYAEVLKTHLPSSCNVYFGGFVFDMNGNESKQIDLIITDDKAIQFNFHNQSGNGKSFSCIDGCIGIASIKSKLDSRELEDCLENIASLPEKSGLTGRHNPMLTIPHYEDWPYKIVYASDGINIEAAMETLNKFYIKNNDIPLKKRPNLIHVAGKYLIVRAMEYANITRDGRKIETGAYHAQVHKVDEYGILFAVAHMQDIVVAASQMTFSYTDLINKLPLE